MEMDSHFGMRCRLNDEEIINFLKKKRLDPDFSVQNIKEIDFYGFDPWELPRYSGVESKETIWYFCCKPRNFKNSKNSQHRKTKSGGWKINGKGSNLMAENTKDVIGSKKYLSFNLHGSISKKGKTKWVMHEIRVKDDPRYKENFVVCLLKRKRNNKRKISTSDNTESEQLIVEENIAPKFVPPPNQPLASDRNYVPEKTSSQLSHNLQVESQQLRCHQLIDVSSTAVPQGESMLFAQFDAFPGSNVLNHNSLPALLSPMDVEEDEFSGYSGMNYDSLPILQSPINVEDHVISSCNGLDYNSFSTQQPPVNPEQRTSSYFDGFSDRNVLNFQFGNNQGDLNSQLAIQNTYPLEETGHTTLSPCFNLSKSVTGVPLRDSSSMNTETVDPWVNGYTPRATGDYSFDSIREPQFNSAEYTSLKFVPPPNQRLVSDRNHVAEKNWLPLNQNLQLIPNQHLISNSRNHVAEKIFPEVECQLPSQYLTSDAGNHVAEKTLPRVRKNMTWGQNESRKLPSHHFISDFRGQVAQVDALHCLNGLNYDSLPALLSSVNVEDYVFSGCNGLDYYSFSAQQSPINPEQKAPSYFDGISGSYELDFQFGYAQGDLNSQLAVQDKDIYPLEETGHTLSTGFNSSKSDTEVHFGDTSATNTEIVSTCATGYSPIAAGDYCFDSIL